MPRNAWPATWPRLMGAVDDIVRCGRVKGIGVTLISQRAAVLHKDVLDQAEVLIALRMTSPRDAAQLKASLPSLPTGIA